MPRTRPTRDRSPAPAPRRGAPGLLASALAALCAGALPGCAPGRPGPTALEREIAAAARPILTMDPDAEWTGCYNRLLELGPASVAWLAEHPTLARPAAPDDLRVLAHASLMRLLIHPALRPHLTVTCLETTLDVLHFDVKVGGERLGTVVWPPGTPVAGWPDLFPADFDHRLAGRIDLEADRQTLRRWWRRYRDRVLVLAPPLRPQAGYLWPVLTRRCADRWSYEPAARTVRCGWEPAGPVLLRQPTCDYNLVRAACIWLGGSDEPGVRERLIELVADPAPVVAYNARFALRFAPDPRIRDLLERYKNQEPPPPAPSPTQPTVTRGGPATRSRTS